MTKIPLKWQVFLFSNIRNILISEIYICDRKYQYQTLFHLSKHQQYVEVTLRKLLLIDVTMDLPKLAKKSNFSILFLTKQMQLCFKSY